VRGFLAYDYEISLVGAFFQEWDVHRTVSFPSSCGDAAKEAKDTTSHLQSCFAHTGFGSLYTLWTDKALRSGAAEQSGRYCKPAI
jgi:hypothetical protein